MTQKQLNKILNILEKRRDTARDHWLKAREYQLNSQDWWLGQMIGMDLSIQEIYDTIIMEDYNND